MNISQLSRQQRAVVSHITKPLNVGLIGLGQWGCQVLLPKLKFFRSERLSCRVGNIFLYDNAQENISEIDGAGRVTALAGLNDMLEHPSINALVVSTPDDSHYEITKQALQAGKHVFVEKCFVKEVKQARELIDLAEVCGRKLMVGYEYMFDQRFVALKKLIDSGKLGKVNEITLHLLNKRIPGASEPWGDATIVEHHSSHQFSILQLLLGNHLPESIRIHEALDNYVRASMNYRDIRVNFTTATQYPSQDNYRYITVKGSRLTVEFDFSLHDSEPRFKHTQSNESIDRTDSAYPEEFTRMGPYDAVEAEIVHFHKLINDEVGNISGGQTAVHMLEMVALINAHYVVRKSNGECLASENFKRYQDCIDAAIDKTIKDERLTLEGKEGLKCLVVKIVSLLRDKPYMHAREVGMALGVELPELKKAYHVIQFSKQAQRELRADSNFDYFNVVDAFFAQQHYEATFFVGLVCPYKCTFCKMQMTALPVHPETPRFDHRKADLLDVTTIESTIRQLAQINYTGKKVSVKISGGLEPLTDMQRVSVIAKSAMQYELPVKLYTNGTLINSQEKRDLLLKFSDVRISLNAINEKKYKEIYLDKSDGKKSKMTLSKLIGLIERLIQDKALYGSKTRIGFNFVVVKETIQDMQSMAELAEQIGIDYINYNIDYFDDFSDKEYIAIKENIKLLKQLHSEGRLGALHVNFGGSLLRDNVFANKPAGKFDPAEMRNYKVFIDPAGNVSPLHEGTFAYRDTNNTVSVNPFALGKLAADVDLKDVLSRAVSIDAVGYEYLAPLELILALEIMRLRSDEEFGVSPRYSPYHMPVDYKV